MAVSDDDIAFVEELFTPLGPITYRKMMGGLSIYLDGQIFAIQGSSGTIFLKAKGAFAETLAGEGSVQFGVETGKTMGYWTMPDAGIDDPQVASRWARLALDHL